MSQIDDEWLQFISSQTTNNFKHSTCFDFFYCWIKGFL